MPKPYIPNDKWSKKAAAEGYRARSVYKLMELDERFHLLKPGMSVLDLGAAPGSWLQYVSKVVGPEGHVVGIDLSRIDVIGDNVATYQADMTDMEKLRRILEKERMQEVDLVLSDAAPSTSGVKDVDQWRSVEVAQAAVVTAREVLRPGGRCVVKVFRGADFDDFLATIKREWTDVHTISVQASRDRSREVYVVMKKLTS